MDNVCTECGRHYKNKNSLSSHKSKAHRDSKGVKRTKDNPHVSDKKRKFSSLTCNYCSEQFETIIELSDHVEGEHGENVEDFFVSQLPIEVKNIPEAVSTVREKFHLIQRPNIVTDAFEQHVFTNFETVDETLVKACMDNVNQRQSTSYKLNICMSYLLYDSEYDVYRVFYGEKNNYLLEKPFTISDQTDIEALKKKLCEIDYIDTVCDRPNTKYRAVAILNIIIDIFKMDFLFGQGDDLPDYITNKTSIIALTTGTHGENYYISNMCAFRAIACFQLSYKLKGLERETRNNYAKWTQRYGGGNPKNFKGVNMEDIPLLEELFEININIYSLQDDETAMIMYKSPGMYGKTMYMNLYKNHLSVIKQFNGYARKYQCNVCNKLFRKHSNMKRHNLSCTGTKVHYPGGFYKPPGTIYDRLSECGIDVAKIDQHYLYFATFDFESILMNKENQHAGKSTRILHEHIPISVSVCSNLDDRPPTCYINEDPRQLVDNLVDYLLCVQKKSSELMRERFGDILQVLDTYKAILVRK